MKTLKQAYHQWGWENKQHDRAHSHFMGLREMLKKLKLFRVKPTGQMNLAIALDMAYHHYTEQYAVKPSKKAPRSKRSKKASLHFVQ